LLVAVTGRAVEAIGERAVVIRASCSSAPPRACSPARRCRYWRRDGASRRSLEPHHNRRQLRSDPGRALPDRIRREGLGEVRVGAAAALGGVVWPLMSAAGYAALAAVALAVSLTALLPARQDPHRLAQHEFTSKATSST
jgi:hypothetical protein